MAANMHPDWYARVLHQHGNIRTILRVQGAEVDPFAVDRRYFAPLTNFDDWIRAGNLTNVKRARRKSGAGPRL